MAQTLLLLQEKGLTDEDALNQRIAELEAKYHDSLAVVKDLEGPMKTNKELRYHVAAYTSAKGIVQQLKAANRPAAFEEQHRAELTAYRAAAAYFKANDLTSCPARKAGSRVRAAGIRKGKVLRAVQRETKEELLKLKTAKQNVCVLFPGGRSGAAGEIKECAYDQSEKIDPEFQSQIPPLTDDDEFKQHEENILKEGKLISPLIVWGNTLVDGHNRYEIVQEHPEISFSTMPLPFEAEKKPSLGSAKSTGAAQPHAGAEEVPHWKAVQCGHRSPVETVTTSIRLLPRKPQR